MGIFDFLKNGRKKYREPDKFIPKAPSEQELQSTISLINQREAHIKDSLKLIKTTTNAEVFFSRYDFLVNAVVEVLDLIDSYASHLSLNNTELKDLYVDITINDNLYIDKLIQRMTEKLNDTIQSLSTDTAKNNHIRKFKESLFVYTDKLSNLQVKRINTIASSLSPSESFDEKIAISNSGFEIKPITDATVFDPMSIYHRWNISISFGKSTSKNFSKALFMAQNSDRFIEDTDEQANDIYQAFYLEENYLEFQRLYKLIGNWKSTFIFINGKIIDTKSLGKINICYGDKLKFNDPTFCYGASEWTSNPFGCHRLMLTPSQTPWWSFGEYNRFGDWVLDKEAIKEKIEYKSILFDKCPAFNKYEALHVLSLLPDVIRKHKDKDKWYFTCEGVMPIDYNRTNEVIMKLLK